MVDKTWDPVVAPSHQPKYKSVKDCTYCSVLVYLNNWNINKLSNKTTTSENYEAIHQVVLYGISDNTTLLVQSGIYGSMNKIDPTTLVYYVVMYVSEAYKLKEETT